MDWAFRMVVEVEVAECFVFFSGGGSGRWGNYLVEKA